MALSPPVINYYIPTTFESEVTKYSSRDGDYVMDFRNIDSIPDSILKNTADFILGSIPMSRIDNSYEGDYLEIDNAFRSTLPFTPKNEDLVKLTEHPAGTNAYHLYQNLYADLVIESENTGQNTVTVNLAAISCNHIKPDGSFSIPLQRRVESYRRENGINDSKPIDPTKFFFGYVDTGLKGVVTEFDPNTGLFKNYPIDGVIPGVTVPGPNKWISLYSYYSWFDNPVNAIQTAYKDKIRFYQQSADSGLYVFNTAATTNVNGKLKSLYPSLAMPPSPLGYGFNSSASFVFDSSIETHASTKKIQTGIAVGREPIVNGPLVDRDLVIYHYFVAYPGAIIQSAGITLLSSECVSNGSEKLIQAPKYVFTVVGDTVRRSKKTLPSVRIKWEKDSYTAVKRSYKVRWQASFDPITVKYKTSWMRNVDLQRISKNLTIRWDKEQSRVKKDLYTFRSSIALPEDELKKQFYAFNWIMEDTNVSKLSYKLGWEHDLSRINTLKYYSEWEKVLGDSCIVKCYYISLYKENNTFVDAISYQVYADSEIVDRDTLSFYFSNPYKFSIIRFDTNRGPYNDTFLSEHPDKDLLSNRDDVPEHFVLIGNYTIEGIDIRGSLSLDVVSGLQQLNEYKSYWIPYNLDQYQDKMITLNDSKSKALLLNDKFKDDYNRDTVELDLVILTGTQCCFTQKATGSRCSPL